MNNNLRVKVDERLDIARLVEQHKAVLFNGELSEEQKTETWSRILNECTARGHHWVKGKDVTYLKKSKWPGIKRDAIAYHLVKPHLRDIPAIVNRLPEHYQADLKSDVTHRKKLTEADVIVLKAISFDTENLGSLSEKDIPSTASSTTCDGDVTQPVTVEVKAGEPLDLLACGMHFNEEEKFDNGLLIDLFSRNHLASRKVSIQPVEQEHRYSKRQRIDDDGPIDHDLMAALGFGKNRHKPVPEQAERVPRSSVDHEVNRIDHITTVGDYLRNVSAASTLPSPHIKQEDVIPLQSLIPPERKPSVDPPKPVASANRTASVAASPSATITPNNNCRDVKFLQKRAYEAQIAREEAMTKYYLLKMKKLELEIEQLQRNKI